MVLVDFSKVTLPLCFCGHSEKDHPDRLGKCVVKLCGCTLYKAFVEEAGDPSFNVVH